MDIGVRLSTPPPGFSVDPGLAARKAEELGFESMWYADHPILPVHTSGSFPWAPTGVLPDEYSHFMDPFIALAQASGATETIKLGTGVILVPERNPLIMAKEIATLDRFSGGRFLFGIGGGWLREETEIMGGDFDHRWSQVREAVAVMKELWTKEEAEFHGRYYDFPPVRSYPKPVQKPHPPILLGSIAPNVFKRVVAWGDGWIPTQTDSITPAQVKEGRNTLDTLAAKTGRDPASISISVYGLVVDLELLSAFVDAGADRVVVRAAMPKNDEEMAAELERIAEAVMR